MICTTVLLLLSLFSVPDQTIAPEAHPKQEQVQILNNIKMLPNISSLIFFIQQHQTGLQPFFR